MIDYSLFYRRAIAVDRISRELPVFDVFVSAFNSSTRIAGVFADTRAKRKLWVVHPEYRYAGIEEPVGFEKVGVADIDEVIQAEAIIAALGNCAGKRLCIDITGFMRHVLVFLVAKLEYLGVREFTALYSEPKAYLKQEHTSFSTTTSGAVRPVRGMAGSNIGGARDHLIISAGYDHKLIGEVSSHKDSAIVHPVFAFPSLSPDMYQQSAVRAADSGEVALQSEWLTNRRFAPGNDPFAAAAVVRDVVGDIDRRGPANVYLAPLATKPHALGLALYWLLEGRSRGAVSVLLPECLSYTRETSVGIRRLWSYTVELCV